MVPRITNPPQPTTLLNDTPILTETNYQKQYTLALNKSDQLSIQISGNGNLVSLTIARQSSPTQPIVDQEDETMFNLQWTVPDSGSYVFTLRTETGANANIAIIKQ